MGLVKMTKWRTLLLATIGFNFSFLIWFSFAPFTGPMAEEFGLSLAEIGILASAAIWLAPFGRILTGWLSDKFGAPVVFAIVLGYVGVFSMASAFAESYTVFFVERLVVHCGEFLPAVERHYAFTSVSSTTARLIMYGS